MGRSAASEACSSGSFEEQRRERDIVVYIDFERPDVLVERVQALPRNAGEQLLVLLADHHQGGLDQIVTAFAEARLPVFGAVFPGLIVGADWRSRGAIVQTFALVGDPLVADLSGTSVTWLDTPPLVAEIKAPVSALVFFDCLSPITGNFVTDLFRRYGNAMSYAGAGAARGWRLRSPNWYCAVPSSSAFREKPRQSSSTCWSSSEPPSWTAFAASPIRRWKAQLPTLFRIRCRNR